MATTKSHSLFVLCCLSSSFIVVVVSYNNHEVIRLYNDINIFSENILPPEDDKDVYDYSKKHSPSNQGYLEVFAQGLFSSSWKRICPIGFKPFHVYLICREKGYLDGISLNYQFTSNIDSKRELVSISEDCNLESKNLQTCFNEAEKGQCLSNVPVYMICYGKLPDQSPDSDDQSTTENMASLKMAGNASLTMTTTTTTKTTSTTRIYRRVTKRTTKRRKNKDQPVPEGMFSFVELVYGYVPLIEISKSNDPLELIEIPLCARAFKGSTSSYFCKSLGYWSGRPVKEVSRDKLTKDLHAIMPNMTTGIQYCARFKDFDCIIYSTNCHPAVVDCYLVMSHRIQDLETRYTITFMNNKVHIVKIFLDLNVLVDASVYVQINEKSPNGFTPLSNSRITVMPYGSCWKNNAQYFHKGSALTITRRDMFMTLVGCQKLNISVIFSDDELVETTTFYSDENLSRTFVFAVRGKVHKTDKGRDFFATLYGILFITILVMVLFACSVYYSFGSDTIGSDIDMYVVD